MTENDNERLRCHRISCYGVVKEYQQDGPRDPPEEVRKKYTTTRILNSIRELLSMKPKTITWHECSVCHEYHPEVDE